MENQYKSENEEIEPIISQSFINTIETREDFIQFIKLLRQEFCNEPELRENNTIELFLEGMAAWVTDMDGYYINNNMLIPTKLEWKNFAEILAGASVYE
jgi:hypothetical protein